ncbi:FAD-dependent oxidoreductase [Streptomyces sp. TRM70350]|uniref:hydroxysqualene dehydroxylase n=1 Tax=Streptomyces sp. TRM70350 TaxID=2856165 RepID=UPI001C439A16|nr:FAD-dependent oxidoreductase [Streptomyces sp. TRM70350]MBV7697772.1 FAD-dependent oxidoreductase [Streptomyces sp. TRM70350]
MNTHSRADDEDRARDDKRGTVNRRVVVTGIAATVAGAAATGVASAGPASEPSRAKSPRGADSGRRVAVLGGGIGGLTAAHELAERGFEVTVYERKELGGKARSIPVPGTGGGGRSDLPGEHGFRFFPGFYQNIPETMARIPFPGNSRGVADNLVAGERILACWDGKPYYLPTSATAPENFTPQALLDYLKTLLQALEAVPAKDIALFASKVVAFLTSGPKRRMGQWENTGYADFVGMDKLSPAGRELLVDLFTSTLVAAKPEKANARTMGLMMEGWLNATFQQGGYTNPDQLLNGPTNEVFIDPWVTYLKRLGVTFNVGWTVTGLTLSGGRITGATATGPSGAPSAVQADWYVLAVPVERALPLLNSQILAADPRLKKLRLLETDWMNGVQIYTTTPVPIVKGHVAYVGQPWAVTSISQGQFWEGDFASRYGDGKAVDCLSVDVSNWDAPGIIYRKSARECSRQQIVEEVLAQIRAALPDADDVLPDSIVHSWFVDPAITGEGTPDVANDEPLLVNTPASWSHRPEATTAIPNLFLAADYVRCNINLATMEGANEAGRAAANGILDAAGSSAGRATIKKLYEPPVMKPFWARDDLDYAFGLPNQFDIIDPIRP